MVIKLPLKKQFPTTFLSLIIIIRNPQAIHIYNKPHNDYITNIKKKSKTFATFQHHCYYEGQFHALPLANRNKKDQIVIMIECQTLKRIFT